MYFVINSCSKGVYMQDNLHGIHVHGYLHWFVDMQCVISLGQWQKVKLLEDL